MRSPASPASAAAVVVPALDHAPLIYGYLRRRVADGPTAERLTVEAFNQAAAGPSRRPVSRTALVRAAAAALRACQGPAVDDLDAPATALFVRALDPELQAAFKALAPVRQRILTLRYLDQLAPAEAGALLDLRPSAFQARLAAAVRALDAVAAAGDTAAATEAVDAA